jgi:hypothetical protein
MSAIQTPPFGAEGHPNQYNTPCSVDISENGHMRNIRHFTDLQLAYMWIQTQMPQELLDHRGEFMKTFEYVVENMLRYPADGVIVGQTEIRTYDVYFTEL